jgi:hypothetical protein
MQKGFRLREFIKALITLAKDGVFSPSDNNPLSAKRVTAL